MYLISGKKWSKFYDEMDLPILMRIIYKAKHHYEIRLKFGEKLLTSSTKANPWSKSQYLLFSQKNLLLFCHKFLAFVIAVKLTGIIVETDPDPDSRIFRKPTLCRYSLYEFRSADSIMTKIFQFLAWKYPNEAFWF